jgi:hypothetical protein
MIDLDEQMLIHFKTFQIKLGNVKLEKVEKAVDPTQSQA